MLKSPHMSEQSSNGRIPPETQLRYAVEANGVTFHDFRPIREGIVAAVAEPAWGGLDGYVYVFGEDSPDITKRHSVLGHDEFDVVSASPVTLDGLDNLPITAILVDAYLTYTPENKDERIQFLKDDCDTFISDIEEIALRELGYDY